MMTQIWSPDRETIADSELTRLVAGLIHSSVRPCTASQIEMLGDISRRILADPLSRSAPQYVALAYWLRKAALTRLVDSLSSGNRAGEVRTPRGVALHLPPTNVDTIFVYSWAMSVLAGNSNVVRMPETMSSDTEWLTRLIVTVVQEHGESERHIFCHYAYGGGLEVEIAKHCDLRMIWGGDAKVAAVSRCTIRPDGLSIGFPDRKSLSLIDSEAYRNTNDTDRSALAERFYNDVYWFDQMGCGSPRLLVWIGEPGELATDFYQRIGQTALSKRYDVATGVAIGKLALSHDLLAEEVTSTHHSFGNALHISRATDPAAALARTHGGGFLCDYVVAKPEAIATFVSRSVQTITHFGLTPDALEDCASALSGRGGYRVVPIGQALQFDTVWDGLDLFEHMTRRILIRSGA